LDKDKPCYENVVERKWLIDGELLNVFRTAGCEKKPQPGITGLR